MSKPVWALVVPWDTAQQGGVSEVVLNLARALQAEGTYEPVVIVQDWSSRKPVHAVESGVRHVFIRCRAQGGGWLRSLRTRGERSVLRALLRDLNVAVLNPHFPSLAATALIATAPARTKVIFSLHGLDILGPATPDRAALIAMLARGDAVVAVSEGFAAEVRAIAPKLRKLAVIHNGVDPERLLHPAPITLPLPTRFILNVAGYEPKKGQRSLLAAYAAIAADYPDLDLVFAGNRASELDGLVARARELGLAERVHFLVDVPHAQIGAVFAAAKVFCLCSRAEPFGLVLLEAGVFGLPLVATNVGGVSEIVRDGVDGLLVPPDQPDAIARALRALLDDPVRAHALGDSLRERARADFSWQRAVAAYRALVGPT